MPVASLANKVLQPVAVRNARPALLDDRSVVENFCDVMRGRADELYAALERLVVRLCADERRQKRMVDIDDPLGVLFDEIRGEYLHITREHDQIDVVLSQ